MKVISFNSNRGQVFINKQDAQLLQKQMKNNIHSQEIFEIDSKQKAACMKAKQMTADSDATYNFIEKNFPTSCRSETAYVRDGIWYSYRFLSLLPSNVPSLNIARYDDSFIATNRHLLLAYHTLTITDCKLRKNHQFTSEIILG